MHAPTGTAGMDRAPSVEARGSGAAAGPGLRSGTPVAPAGARLRLLPSGPDLVRGPTPQGTPPIDAPAGGACHVTRPSGGNRPRLSGLRVQGTANSPPSTVRAQLSTRRAAPAYKAGRDLRRRDGRPARVTLEAPPTRARPSARAPRRSDQISTVAPRRPAMTARSRSGAPSAARTSRRHGSPRLRQLGGVGSAPEFFGKGLDEGGAFAIMDAAWELASPTSTPPTPTAAGAARRPSGDGCARAASGRADDQDLQPDGRGADHGLAPERIERQLHSSLERSASTASTST